MPWPAEREDGGKPYAPVTTLPPIESGCTIDSIKLTHLSIPSLAVLRLGDEVLCVVANFKEWPIQHLVASQTSLPLVT